MVFSKTTRPWRLMSKTRKKWSQELLASPVSLVSVAHSLAKARARFLNSLRVMGIRGRPQRGADATASADRGAIR